MPRKAKNKTIRKAAKQAKEFSDPVNAGEEFSIDAKQSEVTKVVEKPRKEPTKAEELEFLGEWLAQEYLSVELNYNPLEDHHPTRNNKLGKTDGKDPNGRSVEIRTKKRSGTNFVLTKEDLEAFQNAERVIICEYTTTNTIGLWEVLDRKVQEKAKQIRLPIKQLQLLLSFDNQEFAEKMRAKG